MAIATSDCPEDEPLIKVAEQWGVDSYRGPLDDVAGRLLDAAEKMGADAFVRVSGDSPLLDREIVERAVSLFREEWPDLVTNVRIRSFPKGQSVEVIDTKVMRRAWATFENAEDFEHVTPYFYRHADRYRIRSFENTASLGSLQLSVDTETDFQRFETIVAQFRAPQWTYGLEAVLDLLDDQQEERAGTK